MTERGTVRRPRLSQGKWWWMQVAAGQLAVGGPLAVGQVTGRVVGGQVIG